MIREKDDEKLPQTLISIINKLILIIVVLVISLVLLPFILTYKNKPGKSADTTAGIIATNDGASKETITYWTAVDIETIRDTTKKKQVLYGRDLIAHTAKYLGPNGSVLKISNGMNCQNCHLQAGTVVYGNNYGSVASTYPKFRSRSGAVENTYKRINDCFERSLNGRGLDTNSKEMQAMAAYINFIGSNVEKGKKAVGSGFKDLAYLDRAADPLIGKSIYSSKCQSCHQSNGEGVFNADKTEFIYPALWGENSFNDGAGLYRISNMAKYVKYNMPFGTSYQSPQLSDKEAWDVAAFANSQPRPHINVPKDWPDKSKKPIDDPAGPYDDNFSEKQHKLGPFKPIATAQEKMAPVIKGK
ncbi:hypothetical protein BH11BAC3_BH11BAC3_11240 [soil metagenome]